MRLLATIGLAVGSTLLWCELLVHWLSVFGWCDWPDTDHGGDTANVLLLADPHLLGTRKGHWFDKLRREWQMQQSFQQLNRQLKPDVVFILGDLFDEGQWVTSQEELSLYEQRFREVFAVGPDQQLFVVLGNHDVGFHYAIHPYRYELIADTLGMSQSGVKLLPLKGSLFVLLTSMALQNDGCRLCDTARRQLAQLNKTLECLKRADDPTEQQQQAGVECKRLKQQGVRYSRPVLLQHFPLYRESDSECDEPDGAVGSVKAAAMRPDWECLSANCTRDLLGWLRPRLAFGGHTHFGCRKSWPAADLTEWTLASFSWRNINSPSVLLLRVGPDSYGVSKCLLARESSVVFCYAAVLCGLLYVIGRRMLKALPTFRIFRKYKD